MVKYLILPILLIVIMGVSVADSVVSSTWAISNETVSTQTDFLFPVKVGTEALISGGLIGTDGLDWETVDGSDDEVPFAPGPSQTVVEACGLDGGDDTTDCQDAGTADVALLTATGANLVVDTDFMIGGDFQFTRAEFNIDTAGVFVTDPDIVWEYCTAVSGACTVWTQFTSVDDDTKGFTETGVKSVSWDIVPDWVESNEAGSLPLSFYVRARVTTQVDNADYTTQPLADLINYELAYSWVFPCNPCDDSQATFGGLSLPVNQAKQFQSHLGMSTGRTQHRMVAGDAGMDTDGFTFATNSDNAIEIVASFQFAQTGSARHLVNFATASSSFIRWDASTNGALDVVISPLTGGDNCNIVDAPTGITDDALHSILIVFEDDANCEVFVDAVSVATDAYDNASGLVMGTWTIVEEDSINYLESFKAENTGLTVASPTIHFENTDLSTYTPTFLDNQGDGGSGQDSAPSFPLWVTGLVGSATAFLPPTVVGDGADVTQPDVFGALSPIDDFVATPVAVTLPGAEAIDELFDYDSTNPGQEIPSIAFWLGFGAIFSLITLVIAFKATGNIIFTILAVGAVMALFVSLTIFSIWQVFVFAVIATAIALIGRGIVSSV